MTIGDGKMRQPTASMIYTKQQNYNDICASCWVMKKALNKTENINLGEARAQCATCRKIYKFDAIVRAFEDNKQNEQKLFGGKRNTGKKSIITEHERKSIKQLHKDGKTIRQLSELFGYNKNTISKIIHS